MKYYFDDSDNEGNIIEVPKYIQDRIVTDYLSNKYYYTVAIASFIIGFLLGVIA